jgi:pyruvate ferredoxin oxidoreductase beta subunit
LGVRFVKAFEVLQRGNFLLPGHSACSGCSAALALKLTLATLGSRTVVVIPASCSTVIQGVYPKSAIAVPTVNTTFESAAPVAAGIAAAFDLMGVRDVTVLSWAGDGGTFDIGLQAMLSSVLRNDNILYVCYDNEAYMNTGVQSSGATPLGAITTTTPSGKREHKFDLVRAVINAGAKYVATAVPSYADDLVRKVSKAQKIRGFRFIHILSPCPPGWRYDPAMSVRIGRLAVESGMWLLLEYEDGKLSFNSPTKEIIMGKRKRRSVREYLGMQGRFAKITDEIARELDRWIESRIEAYKRGVI